MPIRFRCSRCDSLSSIATRQAGNVVACPICAKDVVVPHEDMGWAFPPSTPDGSVSEPATEQTVKSAPAVENETRSVPQTTADEVSPPRDDEDSWDAEFVLRRRESELDDLDMTPMVDVTFLLLIFFMITASFSMQKILHFPEPDPEKEGAQQTVQVLEDFEINSVIVQIDQRNAVSVDYDPLGDLRGLADLFKDKMRREQKSEILIDAHAAAWHETVVAVVDAANEAGMEKIKIAARKQGGR